MIILTEVDKVEVEEEEKMKDSRQRKGVRGGVTSIIKRFEKLFRFS